MCISKIDFFPMIEQFFTKRVDSQCEHIQFTLRVLRIYLLIFKELEKSV